MTFLESEHGVLVIIRIEQRWKLNLILELWNTFSSSDNRNLIFSSAQEVETTEKNVFTKKVDNMKHKITKARSDLRVKVRHQIFDVNTITGDTHWQPSADHHNVLTSLTKSLRALFRLLFDLHHNDWNLNIAINAPECCPTNKSVTFVSSLCFCLQHLFSQVLIAGWPPCAGERWQILFQRVAALAKRYKVQLWARVGGGGRGGGRGRRAAGVGRLCCAGAPGAGARSVLSAARERE